MKIYFYCLFFIVSFESLGGICDFAEEFEKAQKIKGIFRTKNALFESFRECPHFKRDHLYTSEDLEKLLIFGNQSIRGYKRKKTELEEKINTVGTLKLGSNFLFEKVALATEDYSFVSFVVESIGEVTDRVFETSMEKIVQKKEQQSRDILVGAIQYYARKENLSLNEINSAILLDLANKMIIEVGKEEYPLANYALLNSVKKDSGLILNTIKNVQEAQEMSLSELKKSLAGLDETGQLLLEYGENQISGLEKLGQGQESLKNNIMKLKKLVGQNKEATKENLKHIEFLQEFIFGTMSPDKQLEALQKGWLPNLAGKERKKTERELEIKGLKLQLLADKKEFIKGMGNLAEGTQHIARIMGSLNMRPELIKVVNLSSQVAGSFASIGVSLLRASTGDPLGYLNAASSLLSLTGLFKKKRDIGAERHKQVMSALSDLQDGQFKIREEQWKYYKSLKNGLAGLNRQHEKTHDMLLSMGDFLVKTREKIMSRLDNIYEAVSLNRSLIWSLASEDLGRCGHFLALEKYKLEDERKQSFNFVEKIEFLRPNGKNLYDCYNALSLKFFSLSEISPFLKLINVADDVSAEELPQDSSNRIKSVQEFLSLVYRNISKVFISMGDRLNDYDISLEYKRLKNPVKSLQGVLFKEKINFSKKSEKIFPFEKSLRELFLTKELISVVVLEKYFALFKGIFPYLDLAKNHRGERFMSPLGPEDFFGPDSRRRKNLLLLESFDRILKRKIIPLIELAIAQQALLSGDVALKIVYDLLAQKKVDLTQHNNLDSMPILNLFKYNPIFRNNFVKYFFIRKFNELKIKGKRNSVLEKYTTAFIFGNLSYFKEHFSTHNIFRFKSDGMYTPLSMNVLGEHPIPIPSPDELLDAPYQHTLNMQKLIKMKSEALGHLAEVELMRNDVEFE